MPSHHGGQPLAPRLVFMVKARQIGAVEVQHAQKAVTGDQRDNQLRP